MPTKRAAGPNKTRSRPSAGKARASADRVAGAIMGAFIGDALGLGPHWYYDLDEMRRDYGKWIDGYTDPRRGRYHEGLKAGDPSQTGFVMKLLLQSLAEQRRYDEADFTRRLDEELLACMDGTPYSGPGGYTNQSVREVYDARVRQGKDWGQIGGYADTSEAAERIALLAARYAFNPYQAALLAMQNCRLSQIDPNIVSQSVAFGCVVAALVRGEPLDEALSGKLREMVKHADLPFTHAVLAEERRKTRRQPAAPSASLPFRTRCSSRPAARPRPAIPASASSRPGGPPLSTGCRAPSTSSSPRRITWPPGLPAILRARSCTP